MLRLGPSCHGNAPNGKKNEKKTDEIKHKAVNVRVANEAAEMQHSPANEQHARARTHIHSVLSQMFCFTSEPKHSPNERQKYAFIKSFNKQAVSLLK